MKRANYANLRAPLGTRLRANLGANLCAAALLSGGLLMASTATAQVPGRLPLQGTLYDLDGEAIDGTLPVIFTLYADSDGLDTLWSDTMNVPFVGGIFTAYLGAGEPVDPILFAQYPQVFVGIAVDGDSEMDLFPLATAPYAAMAAYAGDADTLDGFSADDIVAEATAAGTGVFAAASHAHTWNQIGDIPGGFADGVDNVLSETEVDGMVANNGFLTSVSWGVISGIPAGFADGVDNDTQLSELQVDNYVSNNGFLTSVSWGTLTGIPGAFADGIDNVLSEAEVDGMVADNGYLTSVNWADVNNIPAGFADGVDNDTNTQLSESQVDAFVANNGYATSGRTVRTGSCTRYPSSGYLNSLDGLLNARCPTNQVMNGLYSYHNNTTEDRQFAYYCCTLQVQ